MPLLLSSLLHGAGLAAVILVPLLLANGQVPTLPSMMAFVAREPAAPPPPPPPAAPASAAKDAAVRPTPSSNPSAAPLEAPAEITPEPARAGSDDGVEGGVAGGVLGGVVGGIPTAAPAPPPPPPAPAPVVPRAPIRVGGELQVPALLKRVGPDYPELAVRAQVEGVVILEAVVGESGRVEDVRVLRSIPLLDNAAKAAVRQWEYSPLLLNGKAERFIVTVTVSFQLKRQS
ncbi:MAG: energy transducer TonB [Vicinamibacterales bacterium]